MKKYIIGTIFGFVLATAVGANAQEVNKVIDSVVQGVFPVTVEGNSVGDAIVVNDKTYLPVREFGEAVGYKVTFTEDREVVLTKNAVSETPENPVVVPPQSSVKEQIDVLSNKIKELRDGIQTTKNLKEANESFLGKANVPQDEVKKRIEEMNTGIAEAEAKLADYETQLAALQKQQ
jgi:hypothetical protein